MHDQSHRATRHGRTILLGAAILLAAALGLHWGWNSFAVEVLAQPRIGFRQAVALEAMILALFGLLFAAGRIGRGSPRP